MGWVCKRLRERMERGLHMAPPLNIPQLAANGGRVLWSAAAPAPHPWAAIRVQGNPRLGVLRPDLKRGQRRQRAAQGVPAGRGWAGGREAPLQRPACSAKQPFNKHKSDRNRPTVRPAPPVHPPADPEAQRLRPRVQLLQPRQHLVPEAVVQPGAQEAGVHLKGRRAEWHYKGGAWWVGCRVTGLSDTAQRCAGPAQGRTLHCLSLCRCSGWSGASQALRSVSTFCIVWVPLNKRGWVQGWVRRGSASRRACAPGRHSGGQQAPRKPRPAADQRLASRLARSECFEC